GRAPDRRRRRFLLVADAGGRGRLFRRRQRPDQERRLRLHLRLRCPVRGLRGAADAGGRGAGHHDDRGRLVARGARRRLPPNRADVQHLRSKDESKDDRSAGGPVRAGRARRHPVPGPEGRQPGELQLRRRLFGDGALRQHRRAEDEGAGQERGRRRGPGAVDLLRLEDLPGHGRDGDRRALSLSEGHVREHPDLGPARRAVHRAVARRRSRRPRARREDHHDAVGGGAREPDRPVPLWSRFRGGLAVNRNSRTLRLRAALLAPFLAGAIALGGCASSQGPGANVDPLEPMNRAVFAFNDTLDRYALEPAATAYRDYVPETFRFIAGSMFENLRDVWTSVNNLLQGKPGQAASDFGRVVVNTTFG